MADTVQQIKDKLGIVDVVSQYVTLQRAGSTMKGRCPFHSERTPSFVVSPERGTYHCFGCGVGGDIFTFVQEIEGLDFKGALKMLADKAGVAIVYEKREKKDERDQLYDLLEAATIFFQSNLSDEHPARTYLAKRGLTNETIKSFRIGWAPDDWRALTEHLRGRGYTDGQIENAGLAKYPDKAGASRELYDRFRSRIVFPMADTAGRIVAFSGRIFSESGTPPEDIAKYLNSPETPVFHKSRILYGYDRAKQSIRKLNFSILVEGQMDLVSVHQAGWGNAVAVSGTALTPEHVTLLKRMSDNVVLALDADAAGVKAAAKSAQTALAAGMEVKVAALPVGKDPADVIHDEGVDVWKDKVRNAKNIVSFLIDVFERDARDAHGLRVAVEREVLPFIAPISSPIKRNMLVREVADRLGVSESAIDEALGRVAQTRMNKDGASKEPGPMPAANAHARFDQLWGIVLWQRSVPNPQIDSESLAADLREILGKETFETHTTLSAREKEELLLRSEALFGDEGDLGASTRMALSALRREYWKEELAQATKRLKQAEARGDEKAVAEALETCRLSTEKLAKTGESA